LVFYFKIVQFSYNSLLDDLFLEFGFERF